MSNDNMDLFGDDLPANEQTNPPSSDAAKPKKPKTRKSKTDKRPTARKSAKPKQSAKRKRPAAAIADSQAEADESPMILPHQRQTPSIDLNQATDPAGEPEPPIQPPDDYPDMEQRPCYRCYSQWWRDPDGKRHKPGVYYHNLGKGEPPPLIDSFICDELRVIAIARDKYNRSFGQVLEFKNKDKKIAIWNMPSRLLAGRSDELLKELSDMGFYFDYHKRGQVPAYINSVKTKNRMFTASQVGWFDDGKTFILPDSAIGQDAGNVLFQCESNHFQEYAASGTLNEWRDNVAALCADNPLLMFTVSTAFSGALLKPCNIDGAGFHVFGDSSRGKTTGLKAASAWGQWDKYKRGWKSTANGLEGAAALFNDGLLTLDEIGDGDPKELSESIYLLFNGSGKQRANVLGHAKAIKTWRIVVLSNGEKTIEAHLAAKGLTIKAGQEIRFLQLPLFGEHGAFDCLHGRPDGRAFADAITHNAGRWYGTAGRAWLERLTQDPTALEDGPRQLDKTLTRFTANHGAMSAQETRAAKAFALVGMAGELATGATASRDGQKARQWKRP